MSQDKKNIILLGMMGAGKSTVAKKLFEKLGNFKLVDLDNEIEKSAGITISEIFAKFGENRFRDMETQCTKNFSSGTGQIISTGGGIVVRTENLDILRQNGVLFYLNASVETLYNRVKNETHRPLLQQQNPKETLEKLLKERESAYKTADFEVTTDGKDIDKIVEEIVEKYGTRI